MCKQHESAAAAGGLAGEFLMSFAHKRQRIACHAVPRGACMVRDASGYLSRPHWMPVLIGSRLGSHHAERRASDQLLFVGDMHRETEAPFTRAVWGAGASLCLNIRCRLKVGWPVPPGFHAAGADSGYECGRICTSVLSTLPGSRLGSPDHGFEPVQGPGPAQHFLSNATEWFVDEADRHPVRWTEALCRKVDRYAHGSQ